MKKIRILTAAVLTSGFFVLAVHFCGAAQKYADTAEAVLEGQALTALQAEEIWMQEKEREDAQGCCFWGEADGTELLCRETGGSSEAKTVLMKGNPELIVPGTGALAWQENGCFLDEKTAFELFGTQQAAGQTVWCAERSYVVCGTVESLERLMLRQAEEADGEALDKISLNLSGDGGTASSSAAQQFLIRYSLSAEVMDLIFLNAMARNLLLLLPMLLGGWLVYTFAMQAKMCESYFQKAGYAAGAVLLCAVVLFFVFGRIQIPADMVPTKWSNFSFWEQWWEKQRGNLLLMLGTAKGEAQMNALWNLGLGVLCNICAVFSGIGLLADSGKDRKENKVVI